MGLEFVETTQDDRLLFYANMPDAKLKESTASAYGLFMGESVKVVERALDAGVRVESMFLEEKWLPSTRPLIDRILALCPETPVMVASKSLFRDVTGYQITRGPLCVLRRPQPLQASRLLAESRRVAVLEDITNYTNIGAIFRSAAALGVDAVLVTPSCHDPFFRRAARVSMGTVFQVPWARIGTQRDWAEEGMALLHQAGFKVAALALRDDSISLEHGSLRGYEKLAMVLGTEGEGLHASTIEASDITVRIPMAHGVDSLNVAAASAVAFWELVR